MKIKKITITGADDKVDIMSLIQLSKEFPNVEWGILFSKKRVGTPRYPMIDYAVKLKTSAEVMNIPINLSAHICGEWTREFFDGNFTFAKQEFAKSNFFTDIFKRVQLNFNATKNPYNLEKIIKNINFFPNIEFIFQHNKSNTKLCNEIIEFGKLKNISFLYDSSGGRGTTRNDWQSPVKGYFTGYAGGLKPENLMEQILLISKVVKQENIWIDTETGVRTDENELDLNKVKDFLHISSQ